MSFLGQLPVGYINLIAVKVALKHSLKNAIWFSVGVALVEIIYLEVIIMALSASLANSSFFKFVQIITAIVFLFLAAKGFYKWKRGKNDIKETEEAKFINGFFYGVILSATNLAQIPFWIIWFSYLLNLNVLVNTALAYQVFVIGTGLGTLVGMMMYIFFGKKILEKHRQFANYLDPTIAAFFAIASFFQLLNVFK